MAIELQTRYSKLVDAKLRYSIVQKNGTIWNNKYEGDPKAGAVKVPVRDTEVHVGAYNKQSGVSKTFAEGAFLNVPITKDYAVNEVIDGFDAAAVPDSIVADRLDSAGYSLALQVNADGTAELLKGSVVNTKAAITKDTVYEKFVDVRSAMTKKKIPQEGRFALVNPDFMALILKSPEFIKASSLGDAVVQTGAVGKIAGFLVLEDATIPANVNAICGHPDWCCRIEEWAVEPHVQDLNGSGEYIGASAVQGRKIYEHKLTKPETVCIISNVLDPTVEEASGSVTITIANTNATKAQYRKFASDAWGEWTDYASASKPTIATGNKLEARGVDADGVTSGVVQIEK